MDFAPHHRWREALVVRLGECEVRVRLAGGEAWQAQRSCSDAARSGER